MSFDKSAIEEANKHLLALSEKITVLEAKNREYEDLLIQKDIEVKDAINVILQEKNAEIRKHQLWLQSTQIEIRRLSNELSKRDAEIMQLKNRSNTLDQIILLKPHIASLLKYLTIETELPVAQVSQKICNGREFPSSSSSSINVSRQSSIHSNTNSNKGKETEIITDNRDVNLLKDKVSSETSGLSDNELLRETNPYPENEELQKENTLQEENKMPTIVAQDSTKLTNLKTIPGIAKLTSTIEDTAILHQSEDYNEDNSDEEDEIRRFETTL